MAHDGHHDAHHGAHDATPDKAPAFVGLVVGAVLLGSFLFGMVKWTNHHLNAAEPATAAETSK